MRQALLGLFLLAFFSGTASATPDDRYFDSQKIHKQTVKHAAYKRVAVHRGAYKYRAARVPRATQHLRKTIWRGFQAEVGRAVENTRVALGGRPSGCPSRAWCGCFLSKHLGLHRRDLWLARNWAGVGSSAGGPRVGAIVVWRHHVGRITAVDGHRIRVLSGNDGHAVRDRWRTAAGVIAYRVL